MNQDSDDNPDPMCIRTISSLIDDSGDIKNILEFMAHESKNIYNVSLFHTNVYLRYKNNIFEDLYNLVNNKKVTNIEIFDKIILDIYDKYYDRFLVIKDKLYQNNSIIYEFIKKHLDDHRIIITNDNFYTIKKDILKKIDKSRLIIISKDFRKELCTDIVFNILKSMYRHSFNGLKEKMQKRLPCTKYPKKFIKQVSENEFLVFDEPIKYKKLLMENPLFKRKNKNDKKKTIKSDQNYIARIIYKYYTNCTIPSDLMCNIIAKAYQNFNSYFALLKKGLKARKPDYLKQNGQFILPFYNRSRKLVIIDGVEYYRLTIGNHIAENYNAITKNHNYVCLNPNSKMIKQYVDKQYLKPIDNRMNISKKDNFVIGNQYIEKIFDKIIDANYIYIQKPNLFENDQLALIEINPMEITRRFKVNFSYKKNNSSNEPDEDKYLSLDLGVKNIFALHDPNGEQYLVRGSHIENINNYFQTEIKKHQKELKNYNSRNKKSKNKKLLDNVSKGHMTKILDIEREDANDDFQKIIDNTFDQVKRIDNGEKVNKFESLKTSKKLRDLRLARENAIDNYLNHLVNWLIKKYSDCKTIIVGYNIGWKNKCNMGRKNNKRFYEIPYSKFLHKLKCRAEENNQIVCIIEESYTSKCDALALEEICHHKNYLGKRTKRGLFSSSTGKLINADINGAINIMRKWCDRNNIEMNRITGKNIYNPIVVPLSEIMNQK